ncbi:hypothetical protein D3C81_1607770 [compost metagenome]
MITRTAGSDVGRISLRDVSGSSVTWMPAAASSGSVSEKMRPLDSASVSWSGEALKAGLIVRSSILLAVFQGPSQAMRRIFAPTADSLASMRS